MGLDSDFARAFAKAQLGAGVKLPVSGTAFISVREGDKNDMVDLGNRLIAMGFRLIATRGTAAYLAEKGLEIAVINKVLEGQPHIVDALKDGEVQLVINTTEGAAAIADSFSLRRAALINNISYFTTVSGARAAVEAIDALKGDALDVAPLQSYFSD
ncbi:MAG: carbamoyl phosphate synthase large subunit, partial [Rhodospirillaceae bacterium]|nr:carbamoyl phosphate synthase large subunit [Rhodospirillaceae bacterium]